jgi:hypothetical protein
MTENRRGYAGAMPTPISTAGSPVRRPSGGPRLEHVRSTEPATGTTPTPRAGSFLGPPREENHGCCEGRAPASFGRGVGALRKRPKNDVFVF